VKAGKLSAVILGFAAVAGAAGFLFFRAQEREARLQNLQEEVQDLRARHKQLAPKTAIDAVPAPQTGFYEAESQPADGFRRMVLPETGGGGKTETLYVASLPDLVPEDFSGAERNPNGLLVLLNPGGKSRIQALTRDRTAGGHAAREAVLVDGKMVSAPAFWGETSIDSYQINGLPADQSGWAEKLFQEISAANKGGP